ncbi:hypothetical protein KVR01_001048 [Diaporthe batatas]|uniref:uncharacterized protein n=1 Tax=Diaporthe batatas TaxID=748121 RepID=UPI001D05AA7C|nr:uncharacterized protein KVR01_001048 [Diaporthe batatas]KAG8170303.1 hypothetical protein KVR01_001048 [Diaporthe batatas]
MTYQEQSFGALNQAPLDLQPSQEPSIDSSIVSDLKDLNDDDDDDQMSDSDDFWSDSDSSSDEGGANLHVVDIYGALGACYRTVDNGFKTFYRYVEPDFRVSCNVTAASLKEPLSLLTKYRSQRFEGKSAYFRSAYSGPPSPIRRRRQRSPLLKGCPGVHNRTVQQGLLWYRTGTLTALQ